MRVLVTGGAGFIGSHLVDALLNAGHEVRVLDNLCPQVHGDASEPPSYLSPHAEFLRGDVRNPDAVAKALDGVEAVFHEAAAVGVGQSMYEIDHYVSVNSYGAGVLLQAVAERRDRIRKILVASSMSIYGEGAYVSHDGGLVEPLPRPAAQLEVHDWELHEGDGAVLSPVPTPETKRLMPTSVYAVTKRDHEELFLVAGAAYDIPAVALRYFNTYGPRQALSNPYTGALAIFSSQMMHGHRPLVFEDGRQSRDFVHVSDVVRANLLALDSDAAAGKVYNVATGRAVTVLDIVKILAKQLGRDLPPDIVNRYRAGDIRHCFADISQIEMDLGYRPQVTLEDGIHETMTWVQTQTSEDRIRSALEELERRTLMH